MWVPPNGDSREPLGADRVTERPDRETRGSRRAQDRSRVEQVLTQGEHRLSIRPLVNRLARGACLSCRDTYSRLSSKPPNTVSRPLRGGYCAPLPRSLSSAWLSAST